MEPEAPSKPVPIYETTTKDGTKIVIKEDLNRKNIINVGFDMAEGKLPATEELMKVLEKAKQVLKDEKYQNPMLDIQGQLLIKDTEDVVEVTQKWLMEKNRDDALQKAFIEGWAIAKSAEVTGQAVASAAGTIQKETEELIRSFRSLAWSIVRSVEIRDLAFEGLDLLEFVSKQGKQAMNSSSAPSLSGAWSANVSTMYGSESTGLPPSMGTSLGSPIDKSKKEAAEKLTSFLHKLSSKPEYQVSVNHLLRLSHFFLFSASMTAKMTPIETEHLNACLKNLRKFLKRFTGAQELSRFRFAFWSLWEEFANDEDIRKWFDDFETNLQSSLKNPESLTTESSKNTAYDLMERMRNIFQKERYSERINKIFEEGRVVLTNIKNDSLSNTFQDKFKKLVEDLAYNAQGKPDVFVMDKSFDQLKYLLLPMVKKFLENIPIDRIEIFNPDYELLLQDIKFSAIDILPEAMNLFMDNRFRLEFKTELPSAALNRFWVDVQGVRPHFKDIHFFYKRKIMPKLEDEGICDVNFTGEGIRLFLVWELVGESGKNAHVVLRRARCKIDNISVHFSDTKHPWLDKILVTLLSARIRNAVSQSIEDYLYNNISVVNDQLNQYFQTRPLDLLKEKLNVTLQKTLS